MDSIWRPRGPHLSHAHLPGLQLEPQTQLCVVDDGVPPQLRQGQLEVGQGLLEPAGSREQGGASAGKRGLALRQLQGHLDIWGAVVVTQVLTKGTRGQCSDVAASRVWGGAQL